MVACVVSAAAVLFGASPASAATLEPCTATPPPTEPVIEMEGQANLVQARTISRKLRRSNVRVGLVNPANNFTGRPEYPVSSVTYGDSVSRVGLAGAIQLKGRNGTKLRFSRLVAWVRDDGTGHINSRFAGYNRRFLNIQGAQLTRNTETGEMTFSGGKARITAAAALRIQNRFGVKPRVLKNRAFWGRFNLYSLYKVTQPPKDPEGEAPPVPPVTVRPAGATDITSATIDWRVRDSFIRYVNSGNGATAIDGAIPAAPEGSPPLVYSFGMPFTSGWTDESGKALVKGSGGVAFRYCRHTINFYVTEPEIEINGADSRMIFRVEGLDGTAFPDQRAVVVDLDLTQADESTVGNTTTWENIPGFVPQGSAGIFADLYLAGAPFGELDLSVTTP